MEISFQPAGIQDLRNKYGFTNLLGNHLLQPSKWKRSDEVYASSGKEKQYQSQESLLSVLLWLLLHLCCVKTSFLIKSQFYPNNHSSVRNIGMPVNISKFIKETKNARIKLPSCLTKKIRRKGKWNWREIFCFILYCLVITNLASFRLVRCWISDFVRLLIVMLEYT